MGVLFYGSSTPVLLQQQRDGLKRFAPSHIIGKTTAEPALLKGHQPLETGKLIGPQRGIQGFRHRSCNKLSTFFLFELLFTESTIHCQLFQAEMITGQPDAATGNFTKTEHFTEAGRSEERRVGKECRSRW